MQTSCNIQFQRSLLPWKTKQHRNNCWKEKQTHVLTRICCNDHVMTKQSRGSVLEVWTRFWKRVCSILCFIFCCIFAHMNQKCIQVAHGCHHGNPSMFELDGATALECSHITIRSKSDGIPKSDRGLNAQLIFECAQRRCGVVGPVTPGASCETILLTVIRTDSRAANYFFSLLERHATNSQRHMWTYV